MSFSKGVDQMPWPIIVCWRPGSTTRAYRLFNELLPVIGDFVREHGGAPVGEEGKPALVAELRSRIERCVTHHSRRYPRLRHQEVLIALDMASTYAEDLVESLMRRREPQR